MKLKPGPKRIATSTGKPDQRQRDNKKNTRKDTFFKTSKKEILDVIDNQPLIKQSSFFGDNILSKFMNI